MWIRLAEQWELLADSSDGMYLLARELAGLKWEAAESSGAAATGF
jgi:hypothetical protein